MCRQQILGNDDILVQDCTMSRCSAGEVLVGLAEQCGHGLAGSLGRDDDSQNHARHVELN